MRVWTRGLRRRVTLATTLLGFCLSVVFGAVMVYIAETYEHVLVEEILRGQAEDYSLRLTAQPQASLPRTHRLSGYLRRPDGTSDAPVEFAGLPPGIHETADDDEGMHVGVFDTEHGRFYFVIDLSDIEQLESVLSVALIAVIVGGTLLAGWLGWLMANAILLPVTRLVQAVDSLPVRPRATTLAATLGDDELGRLAQTIDRYQQRLVDADDAERAFFADASHELRSPVAVVRGALELLSEDAQDAGARRRVERLERGVGELGDLIDMLFGLVRRREPEAACNDVDALLASIASEFPRASAAVSVTGGPKLPERETRLLARAILRRLIPPDVPGVLRLQATPTAIEFAFTPSDAEPAHGVLARSGRSDLGLGLTLAGRVATSLGWRIEESEQQVRLVLV